VLRFARGHVGALAALLFFVAACGSASAAAPFGWFAAKAAPAGWKHLTLPSKDGTLWYPPALRPVAGDAVSVSAAEIDSSGRYLIYLNATPKQGNEQLQNWPSFRIEHLRDESASVVHEHAHSIVAFRGGTGSCVTDDYITRVKSNHYDEIACLVVGRTQTSVVVAAALTSQWPRASAELERAVSAYQVR
jgi:hypothetical protein